MTFKEFLQLDERNGHGGNRHNSFTVLRMNVPKTVRPHFLKSPKNMKKKLFKF